MSDKSGIEWCSSTWNVLLGCSRVSSGCAHCFAINHVHRMAGNPNAKIAVANAGLTARHANGQLDWTGVVRFVPERLTQPLHWRTPRRIFVNSLSDVFHPAVHTSHIAAMWAIMLMAPQHIYQVLTKRPEHAAELLRNRLFWLTVWEQAQLLGASASVLATIPDELPTAPPAHVHVGTSVENQVTADERIPHLLCVPAAVRWLSVEPQVGPITLDHYLWQWEMPEGTVLL